MARNGNYLRSCLVQFCFVFDAHQGETGFDLDTSLCEYIKLFYQHFLSFYGPGSVLCVKVDKEIDFLLSRASTYTSVCLLLFIGCLHICSFIPQTLLNMPLVSGTALDSGNTALLKSAFMEIIIWGGGGVDV